MAEVKEMTIPLRAAWNVPRNRRANRAIAEIRIHVSRHMKMAEDEEQARECTLHFQVPLMPACGGEFQSDSRTFAGTE